MIKISRTELNLLEQDLIVLEKKTRKKLCDDLPPVVHNEIVVKLDTYNEVLEMIEDIKKLGK